MNKRSNCKICGNLLNGRQTVYCSIFCKNSDHQSYKSQKKRGLERKISLVKKLGGKCSRCGYAINIAALAFHHNKGQKQFQLDVRSLSNRRVDKINSEVLKCILLCSNCHAEEHNPTLTISELLKADS